MSLSFTISKFPLDPHSGIVIGYGTVTLDSSMTATGWAIAPGDLGLSSINYLAAMGGVIAGDTASNHMPLIVNDGGTYKLQMWDVSGDPGVLTLLTTPADDFETEVIKLFFIGPGEVSA